MTDNKIYSALADKEKDSSVMRDMAEMFGLSDNISIRDVNISQLNENAHHPFKVNDDKKLQMLAESIRKDGQMNPIVIRLLQNGRYEILSGHRRTKAIESIGKKTVRAIVVDVDDETANRILINTNFSQRDIVLPSEIAKSYLLRYNDLKKTRNSTGWKPEDGKLDEILAKEFHASKSSVYNYLRFNELTDELLDLIDAKKLKQKIAVELSYLSKEEQSIVYDVVFDKHICNIDKRRASNLRLEHQKRELSRADIITILNLTDTTQVSYTYFSKGELARYADKFDTPKDMENAILEFLEKYEGGIV